MRMGWEGPRVTFWFILCAAVGAEKRMCGKDASPVHLFAMETFDLFHSVALCMVWSSFSLLKHCFCVSVSVFLFAFIIVLFWKCEVFFAAIFFTGWTQIFFLCLQLAMQKPHRNVRASVWLHLCQIPYCWKLSRFCFLMRGWWKWAI